jgi:hypothetical protein
MLEGVPLGAVTGLPPPQPLPAPKASHRQPTPSRFGWAAFVVISVLLLAQFLFG